MELSRKFDGAGFGLSVVDVVVADHEENHFFFREVLEYDPILEVDRKTVAVCKRTFKFMYTQRSVFPLVFEEFDFFERLCLQFCGELVKPAFESRNDRDINHAS